MVNPMYTTMLAQSRIRVLPMCCWRTRWILFFTMMRTHLLEEAYLLLLASSMMGWIYRIYLKLILPKKGDVT